MNHQKITALLRKAGLKPQRVTPAGRLAPGYQVAQVAPRTVAVLCGTRYPVERVRKVLEEAGLSPTTRPDTASDALFIQ